VLLSLAPLQGFTDAPFRRAYQKHFRGIDSYYAPYIALRNDGTIKASQWRDILPEGPGSQLIPQLLIANAQEALTLVEKMRTLACYSEINLNLGCPYPMVTNKGRGSGLLPHPERVEEILKVLLSTFGKEIDFSVKMRCGLADKNEARAIVQVLNRIPIKELIVHPRTAKQLYKGQVDYACFSELYNTLDHPLIFNGDITSLEDYQRLTERFPQLKGVMIGRGILQRPYLAEEVRLSKVFSLSEKRDDLRHFVQDLLENNRQYLSGEGHLLSKMKSYLPYFAHFNPEGKKAIKKMKKCKGMRAFEEGLRDLLG